MSRPNGTNSGSGERAQHTPGPQKNQVLNRTQLAVSNIHASLKCPPCTKIRNAADPLEVGRRRPRPDILRHSQRLGP